MCGCPLKNGAENGGHDFLSTQNKLSQQAPNSTRLSTSGLQLAIYMRKVFIK